MNVDNSYREMVEAPNFFPNWEDDYGALEKFVPEAYEYLNRVLYHVNEINKFDKPDDDEEAPKTLSFLKQTMKEYRKLFDPAEEWLGDPYIDID